MIEVKLLATILLSLQFVAVFFLILVIRSQIKFLFQKNIELTNVRIGLMSLIGIAFIGNFLPVAIYLSTLMKDVSGRPDTLLASYALSNAIVAASSAIGWWVLLKIIKKEAKAAEKEHAKSEAKHARILKKAKEDN